MAPPPTNQRPSRTCATKPVATSKITSSNANTTANRNPNYVPDLETYDHSIICEPINVGKDNVAQIVSCLKNGTRQIKDYLLNECHVIFECRACNALFRCLALYIAHKRIYCKNHYCEKMILYDSTWFEKQLEVDPAEIESAEMAIARTASLNNSNSSDDSEFEEVSGTAGSATSTTTTMQLTNQSPNKTLNPRRLSSTSNAASTSHSVVSDVRKRQRLENIVSGLSTAGTSLQQQPDTISNGIQSSQFYSNEPSTSTAAQSKTAFVSSSLLLSSNEQIKSGEPTAPTGKPSRKRRKHQLKKVKQRNVFQELRAEAEQVWIARHGTSSPFTLCPEEQLLNDSSLNMIYSAMGNFTFKCPFCCESCLYFASAIRHLMNKHHYKRSRAKWIAFLNSHQPNMSAEPSQERSQDSSSVNLKIVKVNDRYQAMPSTPRKSTDVAGNGEEAHEKEEGGEVEQNGDRNWESGPQIVVHFTKRIDNGQQGTYEAKPLFKEIKINLEKIIRKQQQHSASSSQGFVDFHLTNHEFNPLFSCKGYNFSCPIDKDYRTTFYGNAMHHLIQKHNLSKSRAMWIALTDGDAQELRENGFSNGNHCGGAVNGVANGHSEHNPENGGSHVEPMDDQGDDSDWKDTSLGDLLGTSNHSSAVSKTHEERREGAILKQRQRKSTSSPPPDEVLLQDPQVNNGAGPSNSSGTGDNEQLVDKMNGDHEVITLSDDDEVASEVNGESADLQASEINPYEGLYYQAFFNHDDWEANKAYAFAPGPDTTFEMDMEVYAQIDPHINEELLRCRHCPEDVFTDKISLDQHVTLKHLDALVLCCQLCKTYSTAHVGMMQFHLTSHDIHENLDIDEIMSRCQSNGTIRSEEVVPPQEPQMPLTCVAPPNTAPVGNPRVVTSILMPSGTSIIQSVPSSSTYSRSLLTSPPTATPNSSQ